MFTGILNSLRTLVKVVALFKIKKGVAVSLSPFARTSSVCVFGGDPLTPSYSSLDFIDLIPMGNSVNIRR